MWTCYGASMAEQYVFALALHAMTMSNGGNPPPPTSSWFQDIQATGLTIADNIRAAFLAAEFVRPEAPR